MQKLANGFTVIAEKPEDRPGQMTGTVVLAVKDDLSEYAVWWKRDEDQATFAGDYFPIQAFENSLDQFTHAFAAFSERKGY